ncbi:methyltransferase (TIGR00027 family) [Tamaricihabitans halophyticus]|uniref:Methyltransferase (TIGR00027 family) n=1 Tax=Tamaricihabitans halophyticus TaxID=1262583 RepID=A0A4R2QFF5_9PSEU|nr:class I SAM-dependent methyltransferase [Tamaricihabitans halophyticus]TCP45791.1 methyltransferase (TIGR00027 family) [Tamaricihabitans halophyticus]
MSTTKITLSGTKKTMLYTLYFRAIDARSPRPLVADDWAASVLDRLNVNRLSLVGRSSDRFIGLLRARRIDGWTRDFLAEHPTAVVLHLGCGLDSRAFRLPVPPEVQWYDVDFPEIIELRERFYPDRTNYRQIASSVTEPEWLDEIPSDRPTLIIAEGLLMYLSESDVHRLLASVTERFPGGELIFDGMGRVLARLSKMFGWTLDDPAELERRHPRLRRVDHIDISADYRLIQERWYRNLVGLLRRIPAVRKALHLLRFRF